MTAKKRSTGRTAGKTPASRKPADPVAHELDPGVIPSTERGGAGTEASEAAQQHEKPASHPLDPDANHSGDPSTAWRIRADGPIPAVPTRDRWPADRHFEDALGRDLEPAWLRRRRAVRQAVPPEEWTAAFTRAEQSRPEAASQIALTTSGAAIAALPLLVGLALLWLGFGPGQVTFQT